jgi:hypothetical protein
MLELMTTSAYVVNYSNNDLEDWDSTTLDFIAPPAPQAGG